jgi:hypothetical protein
VHRQSPETPEVTAARNLTRQLSSLLEQAPSFQQLDPTRRSAILHDVGAIRQVLGTGATVQSLSATDPYALTLETPADFARRRFQRGDADGPAATEPAAETKAPPGPRTAATETLATRAGALSDEIDFPAFVAGLIHNTFDSIVDATIRQMEAFADLVSAVAKDVEQFTRDNVTKNQTLDWLVEQYPADLALEVPATGAPQLRARLSPNGAEDEAEISPSWLADYGLEGQSLTSELIEEQLIPLARRRVGESRLQMLATMVLLGMNRIVVRDGTIAARVRFRAVAKDKANVDYAVSQDPGGASSWGARGSAAYNNHATMISTVGVNVQAESELKAELFGEVKINFVSETLPLERFVDQARMTLLQRNARYAPPVAPIAAPPALLPAPSATPLPVGPAAPVASNPVPGSVNG